MKAFDSLPVSIFPLFLALLLVPQTIAAYFDVLEPQAGRQWQNGVANPAQWKKGLLDGIPSFDIEIGRLSVDGILLVAESVPASYTALNIYFQNVDPGDDYYLTFMNHTHGVIYGISPKFSVVTSVSSSQPSAIGSAPTVTVTGPPNPTATFATVFPATGSAVSIRGLRGWASITLTVMCGMAAGAFLVFV